jgi:hypothetical protein
MGRLLAKYKSGSLFKSLMIFIFFIVVVILNFFSCAAPNNYLEGTTTLTTTYHDIDTEEDVHKTDCFPNFTCDNMEKVECINNLYKQVGETMKLAVEDYKVAQNKVRMKERFEFCLCGLINIDGMLRELKKEDLDQWKILNKTGFIYHIRKATLQILLLIKQTDELL